MCVEKIISRGVAGPEFEALVVARLCGVATGGSTRIFRGRRTSGVIHRYGLSADPCSRRQAMLRNIREAEGTLVFGRFGRATEALLNAERTGYCCIECLREDAPARVEAWLRRNNIRTLNVIGRTDPEATFLARTVMLEVLQTLGRRPRLPAVETTPSSEVAVVAGPDTCYAAVAWPIPAAWRWRENIANWEAVADWNRSLTVRGAMHSLASSSHQFWNGVPQQVREWVTTERCERGPYDEDRFSFDFDLLEVLGRYGKPATDLARAGRWAILRLMCGLEVSIARGSGDGIAGLSATTLLARRQRELLSAFGFPGTESTVKILAKVSKGSSQLDVIEQIRSLVCDPASRKVLQSLPRVSRAVAYALSEPWLRRVVGRSALYEIASSAEGDSFANGFRGIAPMLYWLREEAERTGALDNAPPVNSLRGLERLLDQLQCRPDLGWEPAPDKLPGIAGVIEPLTGAQALWAEGRAMRHCAAQYAAEMRQGCCLMFRVLPNLDFGTGRATLYLRPARTGLWEVAQLRGEANTLVSSETARFVNSWLFFAHCDPAVSEIELSRACLSELATTVHSELQEAW